MARICYFFNSKLNNFTIVQFLIHIANYIHLYIDTNSPYISLNRYQCKVIKTSMHIAHTQAHHCYYCFYQVEKFLCLNNQTYVIFRRFVYIKRYLNTNLVHLMFVCLERYTSDHGASKSLIIWLPCIFTQTSYSVHRSPAYCG